ncbi:MAG: hypothetical protein JWO06_2215 [Bacteroidota bacterium]|nr:hypothetical protein [Bacteroidota bacterium]
MRYILFLFAFSFSFFCGNSQCLAPFQDIYNAVYVYDGEGFKQVERFPVKSFKVGRNGVMAYIDTSGDMKVYNHGLVSTIRDVLFKTKKFSLVVGVPKYVVTDNLMVYLSNTTISALYADRFITLDSFYRHDGLPRVSDSLVVWDDGLHTTYIFYDGAARVLDANGIHRSKIAGNIFAYMDVSGKFKIFYHGRVQVLEDYEPAKYLVDRDMVLYQDQYGHIKFFQDGRLHETDIPMPDEYWTGNGFGAYISPANNLVVYYNGEATTLTGEKPVGLKIKENIMTYADDANNFFCWYKGKKYMLENYIPQSYKASKDILVYQDYTGRLKALYYGEQLQVSDEIVLKYDLYNETIVYSPEINQTRVWCQKKVFAYGN